MAAIATMPAASNRTLDEEVCYQAVVRKRQASDGLFFSAVRSTGIYCRPSCPSRTPLRKNLRFYATADEAEAAGFRACKRCRPRDPMRTDAALVKAICRSLNARETPPTLAELSQEFGISPFHLQRTFKRVTGLSPRAYAESRRTERLKRGLRDGNGVASAVYGAGYGSSSRAYEQAPTRLGMTPGAYGRGGAGMRITYTITSTDFGRMLVAATERGVSAVSFGEDDGRLEEALRDEYPAAEIARDDGVTRRWVESILPALEGAGYKQLPLDIRATSFRRRVWDALLAIPRGETRTYSQIAAQIGAPKAARAVGNACGANPVAVVIPCHRVVASDGTLGGYAYGLERKKKLLERERE
jgi:AraC family transcriptional regulator of adaptative response/methylated-DNA-[protein]-cysteine methyltransferase